MSATTMRALKAHGAKTAAVDEGVPIPSLRTDYILVKTKAVALNPTDWKHIGFVESPCTIGCDFAGTVEKVGDNIQGRWKQGDRVFGFVHGGNTGSPADGTFGEYLLAKGATIMSVPDDMGFEEAATFGVGTVTVGQGMYQKMGLPFPDSPATGSPSILIYGGSSATGALAIQYAKLSGFEVFTTCSKHNFEFVKSLGADHVFDYSSPSCASDIRKASNSKLYYAWDTISEEKTAKVCADALSNEPPSGQTLRYGAILNVKCPRDDVTSTFTLGYTSLGEGFEKFGRKFEANPDDLAFSSKFSALSQKLIEEKKIRAHRYEVREGGLDGILGGLDDMRNGKISGTKIVYRIS
ncbi:putative zinc-binding oxidoreductase ToxD [Venturia nashicola]|nr:putative zinc-binding oxidoreductase ToxD [Venturia nashicola]